MKKSMIAITFALIALLMRPQILLAQARIQDNSQAPGDWTIVELLKKGEKLSVELKSGKSVKGELASVSQTGLSISEGGKTTDLIGAGVGAVFSDGQKQVLIYQNN
ncbi:MAG: hypothetical protein L0220_02620 [Acidobacteria bacterium]|nr:hypothetical protein [Acidobacteriota bacterium]